MQNFLVRLIISSLAVFLASQIFSRWIIVRDLQAAVLFALVLGLANALIRPLLLLVTCPITLLTLGLFVLVVNALVFWMATLVPVGVSVSGFEGAFLGAVTVSLANVLADRLGRVYGAT